MKAFYWFLTMLIAISLVSGLGLIIACGSGDDDDDDDDDDDNDDDDTSADDDDDTTPSLATCSELCEKLSTCDEDFEVDFGSVAECTTLCNEAIEDPATQCILGCDYDDNCLDWMTCYTECNTGGTDDDDDDDDEDFCEDLCQYRVDCMEETYPEITPGQLTTAYNNCIFACNPINETYICIWEDCVDAMVICSEYESCEQDCQS